MFGRKTKEILFLVLIRFLQVSRGAFCKTFPMSTGWDGRLKPDKLLNPIGYFGDKKKIFFDVVALIFRGQHLSNAERFLFTSFLRTIYHFFKLLVEFLSCLHR